MKRETKIKIRKIILGTIAVAGVLAIAAIAPNALKAIDLFRGGERRKYHMGSYVNRSIVNLKNRGLITFKKERGKTFVRLTEKGERELMKYQLQELTIQRPRKWDKKWRVIIFDIKETRKITREGLRQELRNLGFIKLQNSVWVFPFECEEIIILLKSYFRIGKDVLYMTVEKIENDKWIREKFNL